MTIGAFSAITGVSTYTLRDYEKKGLLRVNRDNGGTYGTSDAAQEICIGGTKKVGGVPAESG